jgi:hypothetical protein
VTTERKLRLHNITTKAALKFGSEAWVLKKGDEQRLKTAQMKCLTSVLGISELGKETNLSGRNLECRTLFWK